MRVEERLDSRSCPHEVGSKFRDRGMANHDEQCDLMANDCSELVGGIANPFVMADRDAAVLAAVLQPLFVGTIRREEVVMPLDSQSRGRENPGKPLAEIPVSEVVPGQAARSYITASSISGAVRS